MLFFIRRAARFSRCGDDHLDDLPPTGDQIGEHASLFVGQRADLGVGGFDEAGNHRRVDRVGLGALAERLGKGPDLGGVDHHHRQRGRGKARRHHRLEAARRLHRRRLWCQWQQPTDQSLQPGRIARHGKGFPARQDMHVQPILRYVDTNNGGVHLHPSLPNRASLAAQATVRVRWNDGRRPWLTHGLDHPRVIRSSVRHRTGQLSR
jgi:hypothetical protein